MVTASALPVEDSALGAFLSALSREASGILSSGSGGVLTKGFLREAIGRASRLIRSSKPEFFMFNAACFKIFSSSSKPMIL